MAMPLAIVWDLIAKDNASATFKRVGDSADHTAKRTDAVSDAFKHMGKAVAAASAVVVAAGIGAVLKTGLDEALDASRGTAQLAAGIKSTGNEAHVSVKGLNALASSIQGYSGQTDDSIVKAEQMLLTFKNIRNQGPDKIFDQATLATANMAAKMGGDASGAAVKLGKALNDPAKGITALTKFGVSFTAAQKESIKAMVKSGDTMGAQKIILKELQSEFGGAAKAAGESLPGKLAIARRSFEDVSQAVAEGLIPVVLPALTSIGTTITKNVIPAVTDFIAGFKAGEGAGGRFRDVMASIGAIVGGVVGWLQKHTTAVKAGAVALGALTGAILAGSVGLAISSGALKAWILQTTIVKVATASWAAVQWILNAALTANPIGIVIVALGALGAGLVLAWKHSETFRNIVTGAWKGIQTGIRAVSGWITGTVLPALSAAWAVVAPVFQAYGELISAVFSRIATAASWLWGNVLRPVFGFILAYWKGVWTGIQSVWNVIGPPLIAVIKAGWSALSVILGAVWNGLATVFGAVWAEIQIVIRTAMGVITGVIKVATDLIKGNWSAVWNDVKGIFSTIWTGIQDAAGVAIKTVADLIENVVGIPGKIVAKFKNIKDTLVQSGKDLVQGFLDGAGELLPKIGKFFLEKLPSWIVTPFKTALGIKSPSTVFAGFGMNVGKGFLGGLGSGAGVQRWSSTVLQALTMLHQPASNLGAVLRRINFESGGNPSAINLTDSNARAGHPSQGLMQTIPSTFWAYAGGLGTRGITDPLANIYAGLNYALHRYGSISAIDPLNRARGYDQGGFLMPGFTAAYNASGKPERILPAAQTQALDQLLAAVVSGKGIGGPGFPDTLVVVDSDGALIGRMKIEATKIAAGASRSSRDMAARDGLRALTTGP